MDEFTYKRLIQCLKILNNNILEFPEQGKQNIHYAYNLNNRKEKFELLINRKSHYNPDYLTLILRSTNNGTLVRFDINGQIHNDVETPHVHIFNEQYDFGRKAIPLSNIADFDLNLSLRDALLIFMDYTKISTSNIEIGML